MIQYLFVALLFLTSNSVELVDSYSVTTGTDITMKSKLNQKGDKLLVKIDLPEADIIFFELYSREGDIKHRWDPQELTSGKHDLALPLPTLLHTTYIVKMVGDKYELKQMLFKQ